MLRSLKSFPTTLFFVILSTLFFVANVAFVSIPYSLGSQPGEIVATAPASDYHPT